MMFLLENISRFFSYIYNYFKPEKSDHLMLFNALSNKNEEFRPVNAKDVKIYCCGPTVYDVPHLGHARTYVFLDVLQRILKYRFGYTVRTVMNITDLDDKIISKGGIHVARKYENIFFETMASLNVQRPEFTPRVSEFIDSARILSDECLKKGYAYKGLENKENIYFETEKYLKTFGKIFLKSHDLITVLDMLQNKDKKNSKDFALWKSKEWFDEDNNKKDEFPGWHTECATMATHHFGKSIDIHVGGIDLKYPHHENEFALGRIFLNEKNWIRFCLYAGHLQIDGRKMSKSEKNFLTVEDMLVEGISPLSLRYFLLKYHYNKSVNFNIEELRKAQVSYEKFMHHLKNINQHLMQLKYEKQNVVFPTEYMSETNNEKNHLSSEEVLSELNEMKNKIDAFLMDNMNVPEAIETLKTYVSKLSTKDMKHLSHSWLAYIFKNVLWITDKYFGLIDCEMKEQVFKNNELKKNDFEKNESENLAVIVKEFRSRVREQVLKQQKELLKLCDGVREDMEQLKNDELKKNDFEKNESENLAVIVKELRSCVREQVLKQQKELLTLCDGVREDMEQLNFIIEDN